MLKLARLQQRGRCWQPQGTVMKQLQNRWRVQCALHQFPQFHHHHHHHHRHHYRHFLYYHHRHHYHYCCAKCAPRVERHTADAKPKEQFNERRHMQCCTSQCFTETQNKALMEQGPDGNHVPASPRGQRLLPPLPKDHFQVEES